MINLLSTGKSSNSSSSSRAAAGFVSFVGSAFLSVVVALVAGGAPEAGAADMLRRDVIWTLVDREQEIWGGALRSYSFACSRILEGEMGASTLNCASTRQASQQRRPLWTASEPESAGLFIK